MEHTICIVTPPHAFHSLGIFPSKSKKKRGRFSRLASSLIRSVLHEVFTSLFSFHFHHFSPEMGTNELQQIS